MFSPTESCCYLSPMAFPHLLKPRDFLPVTELLNRHSLLQEISANIQNTQRENAAIVIQGKPGSGRTSLAIFASTYGSSSTTCVHYFNEQSLHSKHFNLSILESPAIPLCCLQQTKQPSSTFTHIVILDDVVDLKHHLEVKLLVQKIDQSSRRKQSSSSSSSGSSSNNNTPRRKKVLYIFIVDHPESRALSSRMQSLLKYFSLESPTETQCTQIAHRHHSIPLLTNPSPFASIGNLTTLFASIRSFQVLQYGDKHPSATTNAFLTDLPYCVDHRVAEHEKEVVFGILKRVFEEKQEIKFSKQRSLLQNTDIRNVSLHYLENLPIALDKQSALSWKEKRTLYLQTLRIYTTSDYTEFEFSQHENSAHGGMYSSSSSTSSSFSSFSSSSSSFSGNHSSSSSTFSSFSSSASSGFGHGSHSSSTSSSSIQHHITQKEMLQYMKLGMVANLVVCSIRKKEATSSSMFPWENARELEFTKINTKYSMQQSEKWFLTVVSIKLGLYSIPKLLECCFLEHYQGLRAPLESESAEIWKKYLQGHSFFQDKIAQLSLNDFRHLFRFLHMHIGAMTTQSSRLQLSDDVWLERTKGLLGQVASTKRKRKARAIS